MTKQYNPPPSNIAAERAVLAGLCQHGQKAYTDVVELLNSACFTEPLNQEIYACLESVLKVVTQPDYPTIIVKAKELGFKSLEDKTNQDYIISLFNFKVQEDTLKINAGALRKLQLVRDAQNLMRDIWANLNKVNGSEKIADILNLIEEPVFAFSGKISSSSDADKTKLICQEILPYIEFVTQNKVDTIGIPSPWPIYNKAIGGGFRRGGVYVKAARPKRGKSTLALNEAVHCAHKLNIPVLYLDTEMSEQGQLPRIIGMLAKLPMNNIERGSLLDNEVDRAKQIGREVANIPLYYRKIAGKNFGEIASIIRNFIINSVGKSGGKTNDCLVVYDYFKLMDTNELDSMQEYQALGFQLQELTNMCVQYDFPCSAYVQQNRSGIDKDTADTISQSDRIAWFCTSLAILKRKSYEEMTLDGPQHGNAKLIVCEEQRFGAGLDDTDYINLMIQRDKCIVTETCLHSKIKEQNVGFEDKDDESSTEQESF